MLNKFFTWYEKYKTINLGIAAFLFGLQLVHLYWLTTDVVLFKLTGVSYFSPTGLFQKAIYVVDYLELPAIISTSLVYINELRKKFNYKSLLLLLFINSQWIHLLWITDEYVIEAFTGIHTGLAIPPLLAWIAIFIDYLELPVIFDTTKKFLIALKKEGVVKALEEIKDAD
jgi:hypothetical protein